MKWRFPRWLRITGRVLGPVLTIIGLASLPDDVARWATWLGTIDRNDVIRYTLVLGGLAVFAATFMQRRRATSPAPAPTPPSAVRAPEHPDRIERLRRELQDIKRVTGEEMADYCPDDAAGETSSASLREPLETELGRGEVLLVHFSTNTMAGAVAGGTRITDDDVANWLERVMALVVLLPNSAQLIRRFRPPIDPGDAPSIVAAGSRSTYVRALLEHWVAELGKIIDAMEDDE